MPTLTIEATDWDTIESILREARDRSTILASQMDLKDAYASAYTAFVTQSGPTCVCGEYVLGAADLDDHLVFTECCPGTGKHPICETGLSEDIRLHLAGMGGAH